MLNPSKRVGPALQGLRLSLRLDVFLLWRRKLGRPATRLVLTWGQLDALEHFGAVEWHTDVLGSPFYKNVPIIMATMEPPT